MIHEKIRCFLRCFYKSGWDDTDLNMGGKTFHDAGRLTDILNVKHQGNVT